MRCLPPLLAVWAKVSRSASFECQGFFYEDVSPGIKSIHGQGKVGLRRRGDVDDVGLDAGKHFFVVSEPGGDAEVFGGGFGEGGGEIADGDDVGGGALLEAGEVLAGDVAGADDGRSEGSDGGKGHGLHLRIEREIFNHDDRTTKSRRRERTTNKKKGILGFYSL